MLLKTQAQISNKAMQTAHKVCLSLRASVTKAWLRRKPLIFAAKKDWKQLAALMRQAMLASHLKGMEQRRKKLILRLSDEDSVFDSTIDYLERKLDLSADELDFIEAYYDTHALKIVGDASEYAEKRLEQKFIDLTERGAHVKEGVDELNDTFDDLGLSPLKDYQLETLFRTQTRSAYGAGLWHADQDEAIDSILWGYTYSDIEDTRETDICEALGGTTLPKEHDFWQVCWFPNHYNCRSDIIELFEPTDEVGPPDNYADIPAEGFGFNMGAAIFDGLSNDSETSPSNISTDETEFSFIPRLIAQLELSWAEEKHPRDEHGRWTTDEGVSVVANPDKSMLHDMISAIEQKHTLGEHDVPLRYIYDHKNGELHVFSAWDATHDDVAPALKLKSSEKSYGVIKRQEDGLVATVYKPYKEKIIGILKPLVDHVKNTKEIELSFNESEHPRDEHGRFSVTATPSFKNWFGDSKVTNPDGSPRVVYHGTRADIAEFHTNGERYMLDRNIGTHFAEDADVTTVFATGQYARPSDYNVSDDPERSWYRDEKGLEYDGIPMIVHQNAHGEEISAEPYNPKIHGSTWQHRENDRLVMVPPGGKVYPVYLSIKHPLVIEPKDKEFDQSAIGRVIGAKVFPEDKELFLDALDKTGRSRTTGSTDKPSGVEKMWEDLKAGKEATDGYSKYKSFEDVARNFTGMLNGKELSERAKRALQKLGYDGIKYKNTSANEVHGSHSPWCWIAFEPEQIKSATGNKGTFDPKEKSITASVCA